MRLRIILILCFLGVLRGFSAEPSVLMSYNIHNGVGLDKIADYARIGELIKALNPDVVAIQEADSVTERSQGHYVLGDVAENAGMNAFFAPAIDFRGGKYGIGILCKAEPLSVERYALPGREEKRALIVAEFDDFVFACVHLSLTEQDRLASLPIISNIAKKVGKTFYIAGDFNAEPSSQFFEEITKEFTPLSNPTQLTFPADVPDRTLDYILIYNPAKKPVKADARVISEPAMSDHRPVIVTLK